MIKDTSDHSILSLNYIAILPLCRANKRNKYILEINTVTVILSIDNLIQEVRHNIFMDFHLRIKILNLWDKISNGFGKNLYLTTQLKHFLETPNDIWLKTYAELWEKRHICVCVFSGYF